IVIPLVTHGITLISRFQLWTQPIWLLLQLLPFIFILYHETTAITDWQNFSGQVMDIPDLDSSFNILYFGAASAVIFSLIAQIGEQVDFLRFLPEPQKGQRLRWWTALIVGGPGWIVVGVIKILAGSFLVVLALKHGLPEINAADPTRLYLVAFSYLSESPLAIMAMTGFFVILCQVKINVTNAYAGSIAWSNFFSRLTHSHPGRVVWLFFNVIIALLLMVLGVYESLEHILGIYSNVAVAWVGALVADLVVNKPLGLSPKHIEFKRAYLYDINPVGVVSMIMASLIGVLAYVGMWGELAQALSAYIALITAFVVAPVIAILTKGRYYLAREIIPLSPVQAQYKCVVCDNDFDSEDIAHCPAYSGHICSLCCTLESRCHDKCKENARLSEQVEILMKSLLPQWLAQKMNPRLIQFVGLLSMIGSVVGVLFWLVYLQVPFENLGRSLLGSTLIQVYLLLLIIVGVLIWLFVLANESREMALDEATRQTDLLSQEISAHEMTDQALQQAKELAEAANQAKSRYLGGISHELRSPLNSILGYAQLLERDNNLTGKQKDHVSLIRRSGDHLADLIEGLLDLSRIEAGRLEIRRDEVDFQTLLHELTDMFRMQAEAKGIQFICNTGNYLPEIVRTDEKHLRQILINLLSNAVKYTQYGFVKLDVNYRSQVAEFIVTDTGIGIEAHEKERIFKPFERIRRQGGPQQAGTGLGLTISQLLADIMGGEITMKSEMGRGSVFKLSMMLSSVSNPSRKAPAIRKVNGYEGDKLTIMVVDDEPSHRGLISEILTPLGFTVLEEPDAFACQETLQNITRYKTMDDGLKKSSGSLSIDLLLLDISMPGKTGWQLLKELREEGHNFPVMMVSADAEDQQSVEFQGGIKTPAERTNQDYLIKPIRDQVLLSKIAKLLKITWTYESPLVSSVKSDTEVIQTSITQQDARDIINMAELGYVAGIEEILERLKKEEKHHYFVEKNYTYLKGFRFDAIIELNKRMLNYE
ncbi:MAG: ATP-binding protein, partial [Oleibacter sp.]|nr:ATP-binding protein [Thalassolituus sp.]